MKKRSGTAQGRRQRLDLTAATVREAGAEYSPGVPDGRLERREPDPRLDQLTGAVIGAAIEVHRHLGPGHLESVYEAAMAIELAQREVPFQRQVPMTVRYKGQIIHEARLDLLVDGRVIVELKAVDALAPVHKAKMISYLRASGKHLGLIINFNVAALKSGVQRVILS